MAQQDRSDFAPQSASQQAWVRWRRTGLVAIAIVVVLGLLYVARGALFPFIISIVLAQLLYPAVVFLEERMPGRNRSPEAARIVSILSIYLGFVAILAVVLYLSIPPLFHEAQDLAASFPELFERSRATLESWSREITERIPADLRAQLEETVAGAGDVVTDAALSIIGRTASGVANAVTLVIGLAIVPFLLFYILKDRENVVGGIYAMLPPRGRRHTRNVVLMVNEVVGSYVRAQLLSALIVGVLVFVGLAVLDIEFAAVLGLVAGLFALIPIIGPLLGAVPGLLVALASSPEKIIWVALVYLGVQLIENNLIAPRLQGSAVRLNPAIIIATLVLASEVAGLWGVIVAVPLVAATRDVFVYFYNEWSGEAGGEPPETQAEPGAAEAEPEPASREEA